MKNLFEHIKRSSLTSNGDSHGSLGRSKKQFGAARIAAIIIAVLTVLSLAACSIGTDSTNGQDIIILGKAAVDNSASASVGNSSGAEQETDDPAVSDAVIDVPSEAVSGDFAITTEDGALSVSGSTYTVTAAGTYVVNGTLEDGQIVIDAGEDDEIELVLSGASVTCTYDSPVIAKSAGKLKIKAADGTTNVVTDARAAKTDESDTTGGAAIYAECDLNLAGSGSLIVKAGYNNGIQSKDDLKIKNLTLTVTAPGNALKGNDSITIESGTLTVVSTAGDGLKTENSDVSSKGNQRGTITISGGTVNIFSAQDGIDASYDVVISGDPVITVNTHAYSAYTASAAKKTVSSGGVTTSADSSKGIKADNQITISGGTVSIRCMDDGIHANSDVALENGEKALGNITISGGSVTVSAADDGIHADGTLLFEGGCVEVVNSHEGLEGHYITVNGGEIRVYATDDGVNATSSAGSRSADGLITVSGGTMIVEVGGRDVDGIDSNGSYKQTGGIVIVSNPGADSSGNMSAVDVDSSVSVTGGIIVALGTVPGGGNAGAPGGRSGGRYGMGAMSSGSTLPSGYVNYSGSLSAGSHTFTYGNESVTFTLRSQVSSGWLWASGITSGNYTLK